MKRVLITGTSRGLGRALTKELGKRNYEVVATARQPSDLDDLKAEQKIELDVNDSVSVKKAVEIAGAVDVVINNAGITLRGPVESVPSAKAQQLFETNVIGPMRVSQAFLHAMREQGHGKIINISSLGAASSPPLHSLYSASKAALERLSEGLHFEVQHFGVKVVIIQAGSIQTGMAQKQQKFPLEPYKPLINQFQARFDKYQGDNGGNAPSQIAEEIADVVEKDNPSLRISVGSLPERMMARIPGRLRGRMMQMGLDW